MTSSELLIISPHLDDAALSLGGMILQNPGCRVLDLFNTAWSVDDQLNAQGVAKITATNLDEETRVMKALKASFTFKALPEALDRDPSMSWCAPIDLERDHEVQLAAAFAIASEIQGAQHIFIPMAVGEHTDHILVHDLANLVLNSGKRVSLYEDLPYATYNDDDNNFSRRLRRVSKIFSLQSEVIDITDQLEQKLKVLENYKSQLNNDHIRRVQQHALGLAADATHSTKACERVWHIEC